MKTTHELSKAIQDLKEAKMAVINHDARAKYVDLVIGTVLFLVFVGSLFLLSL